MSIHIKKFRKGFKTRPVRDYEFTSLKNKHPNTGISFEIISLNEGDIHFCEVKNIEVCVVLLQGDVFFGHYKSKHFRVKRKNLLDQNPHTFLTTSDFGIISKSDNTELALIGTKNISQFKPRFFPASDVQVEKRGKGKLNDTAYRYVRTVFDKRNMPQSNLVVGEVITLPGRWSSYPPHHHPQPEIYFYRFFPEEGYGFAQVGDNVYKVENNDLIKITAGKDHPQVAAPGYTMWYLWVIRHLPRKPYIEPEFTKKHQWVFKNDKRVWKG